MTIVVVSAGEKGKEKVKFEEFGKYHNNDDYWQNRIKENRLKI